MIKERRKKKRSEHLTSRYRDLDILILKSGIKVNETYKLPEIPVSKNDRFHEVTSGEVNRLDLIAYKYYQDAKFWWIIALTNDLTDPFYLERGTILRIPSKKDIFGRDGVVY